MLKSIWKASLCLLLCYAVTAQAAGVGGVADFFLDPVFVFSDFVNAGCFVIGGSFLFAAIIKYMEHRNSPLMVPISTPVFLVVGGIILLTLPFVNRILHVIQH